MNESVSRRAFLSASGSALAGCAVVGEGQRSCLPDLCNGVRIGILSDTHVTGAASAEPLALAFEFLVQRSVDAVVHCGDVTDLGYLDQLDVFISVWRRVMPPDVPLVAAFGNRDMSDTAKMSVARRKAERPRLILADPASAMRRLCGWSAVSGVRALRVKGVALVAADWRHEGELEAFLSLRPELRNPGVPLVAVQHPHPQGTVFATADGSWMADDGRAGCFLKMFPQAWSFSGHSHVPFAVPFGFWRGDFTAAAAGSYYLGPPSAQGGREVSVLTLRQGGGSALERCDLATGFREVIDTVPAMRRTPTARERGSIVFAQWNIGHFCFGRRGETDVSVDESDARAAAYRRQLETVGADMLGICEYSPVFDVGGRSARGCVFGRYRAFSRGRTTATSATQSHRG